MDGISLFENVYSPTILNSNFTEVILASDYLSENYSVPTIFYMLNKFFLLNNVEYPTNKTLEIDSFKQKSISFIFRFPFKQHVLFLAIVDRSASGFNVGISMGDDSGYLPIKKMSEILGANDVTELESEVTKIIKIILSLVIHAIDYNNNGEASRLILIDSLDPVMTRRLEQIREFRSWLRAK